MNFICSSSYYIIESSLSVIEDCKNAMYDGINILRAHPLETLGYTAALVLAIALETFADLAIEAYSGVFVLPFFGLALASYAFAFVVINCLVQDLMKWWSLQFIEQHSIETVKNQDVVLVLQSSYGAFLIHKEEKQFLQRYPVVIRTISHLTDVDSAIDETVNQQHNSIKALFIKAHGDSSLIKLGVYDGLRPGLERDCDIVKDNVGKLRRCLSKLEQGAPIILGSCCAGGMPESGDNNQENIAQLISRCASGRIVTAASEEVSVEGTEVTSANLEVNFYKFSTDEDLASTVRMIKAKAYRILYLILGLDYRNRRDITRRYQNGVCINQIL